MFDGDTDDETYDHCRNSALSSFFQNLDDDESERMLLACVMADYENARLAVKAGLASHYRSTRVLRNVMDAGGTIDASEDTDEAVGGFLASLNTSLTRWDTYAPSTAFEVIVHGMVLNAQDQQENVQVPGGHASPGVRRGAH